MYLLAVHIQFILAGRQAANKSMHGFEPHVRTAKAGTHSPHVAYASSASIGFPLPSLVT
ncbi:MAG: hypothetical protein ACREHD_28960 [Pirellulales bacterium]